MEIAVDNTGNCREWPSEEILAYYLMQEEGIELGPRIMELGAGKSGLVGLAVASLFKHRQVENYEIVITDGNSQCVSSLAHNIALNP